MEKINCILLIDDNPADNEFHKINIRKANVSNHVRVALDGEKALEYLKKSGEEAEAGIPEGTEPNYPKPDIIFLDINMPGMNGFEFLDEYKKLKDDLKTKVVIIMLTTSLNPDDQKRAVDNPDVAEFQNKPLTVDVLMETARKYFDMKSQ